MVLYFKDQVVVALYHPHRGLFGSRPLNSHENNRRSVQTTDKREGELTEATS